MDSLDPHRTDHTLQPFDSMQQHSIDRSPTNESTLYGSSGSQHWKINVSEEKQDVSNTANKANVQESLTKVNGPISKLLKYAPIERVISAASIDSVKPDPSNTRPWRSSVLRLAPLTGILAMLIAAASIVASLGILVGSNGDPISTWTADPAVYLAIFTAIANLSMRYACIQGIVIAWWIRALNGSSMATLHYNWRAGTTIHGALSRGRNMGLLGLACIFSTVVVIDGPLLQRATSVKSALIGQSFNVTVRIAQEIPNSWTGGFIDWHGPIYWYDAFNRTAPSATNGTVPTTNVAYHSSNREDLYWGHYWFGGQPIRNDFVTGCESSKCKVKIRAPALAATVCRNTIIPVDYYRPSGGTVKHYTTEYYAEPLSSDLFIISMQLIKGSIDEPEQMDLITAFGQNNDCVGTLNISTCSLASAVGDYDVLIDDNIVTIDGNPTIISLANNTRGPYVWSKTEKWYNSTLAGLMATAQIKYDSAVSIITTKDGGQYHDYRGKGNDMSYVVRGSDQACANYTNPHNDVMQAMNQLMFLTGLQVVADTSVSNIESRMDAGLPVQTTTMGYGVGDHPVHHTDYWFFFAAAAVELVCIAFVAPTYWGWWRLGRPVSLSPIETAKAFDSPLLANVHSNSSAREVAKATNDTCIQYGSDNSANGRSRLVFANPEMIYQPKQGEKFDS